MPRLWYTDHHNIPLPEGHKFPLSKYRLLREALQQDPRFTFTPAPLADAGVVETVHDAQYVREFLQGTLDARVMRRIGFPWSQGLVARTMASIGSTLAATRDALDRGWGGSLAGGTHHAFRSEGSGFCVFNDIAVAIRAFALPRVSVVDLDVHQGDGTAQIFEGDSSVFTLSLHGRDNFPFRKQRSSLDVPLADGTSDAEYLEALRGALPQAFDFAPEFVFFQSGVDGLASDRLGRLKLTHEGLMQRDAMVFESCRSAGVPCVVVLGGGYSDPIELTVEAHRNTFRRAADLLATQNTEGC